MKNTSCEIDFIKAASFFISVIFFKRKLKKVAKVGGNPARPTLFWSVKVKPLRV